MPRVIEYYTDYKFSVFEKDPNEESYKKIKKLKNELCFREDSDLNIKFAFEKAVKKHTQFYVVTNTQKIKWNEITEPEKIRMPISFCFVKTKETTAEILLLCSNWRFKGKGKQLLQFVLNDLKDLKIKSVFVEGLDNKKLIEFYKSLGFTNGKKEEFTESPPDNQLQSLSLELGGKSSSNKVNSESLVLKLNKPEPEWIMWN